MASTIEHSGLPCNVKLGNAGWARELCFHHSSDLRVPTTRLRQVAQSVLDDLDELLLRWHFNRRKMLKIERRLDSLEAQEAKV
jgi:hypothetical protein